LAFDLDDAPLGAPPVIDRSPEDLPDRDRATAKRGSVSLSAGYHAAGGPADDPE
jgi:hypothetical protein